MRVRRQDGFTLIELLVAMVIGMFILLAGFKTLDSFGVATATVVTRTDNTQRGRLALDGMVRALRSQACTGPAGPSLLAGSPTSVSFVTDLGDGTTTPEKRTITYDAATRDLSETRVAGTRTTTGTIEFTKPQRNFGVVLRDVEAIDATTPIFGFYVYDTKLKPPRPTEPLPGTVETTALGRVARITIGVKVGPSANTRDRPTSADLQDEVFLRSVDPSDPVPLPLCS